MRGMRNPKLKPAGIFRNPHLSTDHLIVFKSSNLFEQSQNSPFTWLPSFIMNHWNSSEIQLFSHPESLRSPSTRAWPSHPVAGDGTLPQGHQAPKTRHAFPEGLTTGAHRPIGLLPMGPMVFPMVLNGCCWFPRDVVMTTPRAIWKSSRLVYLSYLRWWFQIGKVET